MEHQEKFDVSLDVEANIVSLCLVCHKQVHHATFEDKNLILTKIFHKRTKRLNGRIIHVKRSFHFSIFKITAE